jgi:hypothetical protein
LTRAIAQAIVELPALHWGIHRCKRCHLSREGNLMQRFYTAPTHSSSLSDRSSSPADSLGGEDDPESSSDRSPRTPRETVRMRCLLGQLSMTRLAPGHTVTDQSTPQQVRRAEALDNIGGFYTERIASEINGEYAGFDTARLAAEADRIQPPSALTALRRAASFVLIAPVLESIDGLVDADVRSRPASISAEDRVILDEAITAVQVCHAAVEANAVGAAHDGTRGMPLSLDQARFQTFLADQEPVLTAVIGACARPAPDRATALQPLLRDLAEQYFIAAGRRLNGMLAGTSTSFNGQDVGPAPVELLVGVTEANDGMHVTNPVFGHEQVIVSMGSRVINSDAAEDADPDPQHQSLTPAQRRGIEVLSEFFRSVTALDEQVIARAVQVPAGASNLRQQARGTLAELVYAGDQRLGDACRAAFGPSQRERAMQPLRLLPQQMRYHQNTFGAPLLGHRESREWVLGPTFHSDLDTIMLPAARLPNAQVASTERLLLANRAFGGQRA